MHRNKWKSEALEFLVSGFGAFFGGFYINMFNFVTIALFALEVFINFKLEAMYFIVCSCLKF